MTIDIDAIRKREQAATEGPWTTGADEAWSDALPPWALVINASYPLIELQDGAQGKADAEFIAHARQDIPALLAEIERLRREHGEYAQDNNRLRAQVADLADKLHKAQQENASHTKAATAWANEVAAKDRVIEAVESLLRVTDGDPLGDRGIAIPLGEIRRVVGEARAEVAR